MKTKTIKVVQLVLALQYVEELIEELKHTPYFKQDIKQKAKSLQTSISPLMRKELADIVGTCEETVINVLRHQEELITRIAQNVEPHGLCAFNQLLTNLIATPDSEKPAVQMTKLSA